MPRRRYPTTRIENKTRKTTILISFPNHHTQSIALCEFYLRLLQFHSLSNATSRARFPTDGPALLLFVPELGVLFARASDVCFYATWLETLPFRFVPFHCWRACGTEHAGRLGRRFCFCPCLFSEDDDLSPPLCSSRTFDAFRE